MTCELTCCQRPKPPLWVAFCQIPNDLVKFGRFSTNSEAGRGSIKISMESFHLVQFNIILIYYNYLNNNSKYLQSRDLNTLYVLTFKFLTAASWERYYDYCFTIHTNENNKVDRLSKWSNITQLIASGAKLQIQAVWILRASLF